MKFESSIPLFNPRVQSVPGLSLFASSWLQWPQSFLNQIIIVSCVHGNVGLLIYCGGPLWGTESAVAIRKF